MNEFLSWWIEKHYIWSTLLTPQITLAWAFYQGLWMRGIMSVLCGGFTIMGSRSK